MSGQNCFWVRAACKVHFMRHTDSEQEPRATNKKGLAVWRLSFWIQLCRVSVVEWYLKGFPPPSSSSGSVTELCDSQERQPIQQTLFLPCVMISVSWPRCWVQEVNEPVRLSGAGSANWELVSVPSLLKNLSFWRLRCHYALMSTISKYDFPSLLVMQ